MSSVTWARYKKRQFVCPDSSHITSNAEFLDLQPVLSRLGGLNTTNVAQQCSEIQNPEGTTFRWVLSRPGYAAAVNGKRPQILHILGKPGSGKSVLGKYLYQRIDADTGPGPQYPAQAVLFFFFLPARSRTLVDELISTSSHPSFPRSSDTTKLAAPSFQGFRGTWMSFVLPTL